MIIFKQTWIFFLILTVILVVCYLFIKNTLLISDEGIYYPVIKHIAQGKLPIQELKHISVLPLFFFVTGILVRILGFSSAGHIVTISIIRGLMVCISLCSIFLFFFISKTISSKYAQIKTLEYVFSPLFFPFFFLIYTEIFSLLFILGSFYLLINKRYFLSGCIASLSIFIRQDNIFWIGFFCIYIFLDMLHITGYKFFIEYLKRIGLYIFCFIVLGIFVIFNKGNIAIGDAGKHPFSFHMGNIYFFLLLQLILFPFFHISHITKIGRFVKKYPVVTLLCMLSLLPFFIFRIDHQYNQLKGLGYFYLRNHLLRLIISSIPASMITYIILLWSFLSLAVTKFWDKKMYSIYPFILIALSMQWLIEQRYSFVPVAFFILFKKEESYKLEAATIVYSILFTLSVFLIVFETKFFI